MKGSASIGGSLGIAGGITPIYTTPSFGPGQVGYVIKGTFNTTTTWPTGTKNLLSTLTFGAYDAGMWIIQAYVEPDANMTTSGAAVVLVEVASGSFPIPNSSGRHGVGVISPAIYGAYSTISYVAQVPGVSSLALSFYNNVPCKVTAQSYFQAIRIA